MTDMPPTEAGGGPILEVDLDAVAGNWTTLRASHPAGAVAAVVKADVYGTGAAAVAARLYREGCRHVLTATLDEALTIRGLVPEALVAVLSGLPPGTAGAFRAAGVTPVLGSLDEIDAWRGSGGGAAILHIDTGMNRLGLPRAHWAALRDEPALLASVQVLYVMTHLVSSELPADPLNARQLAAFAEACAMLPPAPRSLANSSGIFLGSAFASDLARPGAALYGINPTPGRTNPMRPVVRLRTRVQQVRNVAAGETVGYNATWRASGPRRIATAAIGYADGWLRSQSNRGAAIFDGNAMPLVGRVSMDLTTFDVTGVPGVEAGVWLDLIGPGRSLDDVAMAADTNAYEVLTALGGGRRVRRVYHGA
jgi:alanine racemase